MVLTKLLDRVGRPTLAVLAALALVLWWNHGLVSALLSLPHVLWFVALAICTVKLLMTNYDLWRGVCREGLTGRPMSRERLSRLRPLLLRLALLLLVLAASRLLPDPVR